jgi:hypothetical protein
VNGEILPSHPRRQVTIAKEFLRKNLEAWTLVLALPPNLSVSFTNYVFSLGLALLFYSMETRALRLLFLKLFSTLILKKLGIPRLRVQVLEKWFSGFSAFIPGPSIKCGCSKS